MTQAVPNASTGSQYREGVVGVLCYRLTVGEAGGWFGLSANEPGAAEHPARGACGPIFVVRCLMLESRVIPALFLRCAFSTEKHK